MCLLHTPTMRLHDNQLVIGLGRKCRLIVRLNRKTNTQATTNISHVGLVGATHLEKRWKENYDTWHNHMEELLIKNDIWTYISDERRPLVVSGTDNERAHDAWIAQYRKVKSSELGSSKDCPKFNSRNTRNES